MDLVDRMVHAGGVADHPWNPILDNAEALARDAGAARASVGSARGSDPAAAVTAELDGAGRVASVEVAVDWRERLRGGGTLAEAVGEAVEAATRSRLETWARVLSDPESATEAAPPLEVPTDFAHRLQEAATGELTAETGAAALGELLELLQQVEQGLDEVSSKLSATVNRALTGRSANDQVRVTVNGGGELREVRFERRWLRQAHATDIARQISVAFRDAYGKVDREGVTQLVAGSALGEAQRAVQDPFGLARRMRLTD